MRLAPWLIAAFSVLVTPTPITSVPFLWHACALFPLMRIVIVPIESEYFSPVCRLRLGQIGGHGMKMIHLCYAAIGFAVARWIFKRQSVPVADPVSRFRTSGLL